MYIKLKILDRPTVSAPGVVSPIGGKFMGLKVRNYLARSIVTWSELKCTSITQNVHCRLKVGTLTAYTLVLVDQSSPFFVQRGMDDGS